MSISLERLYFEKIQEIELTTKVNFSEFLSPSECDPASVAGHLHMESEGIIVSTGTERSFFDLALAPPLCQGLVVVDICHKVKAYVDFNTLLLRISDSKIEYAQLSADIDETKEDICVRVERIREKLIYKLDNMNGMDTYYKNNLEDFAKIYFGQHKDWRISQIGPFKIDNFEGVRYHLDDHLFLKLQYYAQTGNIIAVVGDIQELSFLEAINIEVIDTSNISDYTFLNLKSKSFFRKNPTIIWTNIHRGPAAYYSKKYIPSDDESSCQKIDHLLNTLKQTGSFEQHSRIGDRFRYICGFKRSDVVALTAETVPIVLEKLNTYGVASFSHEFFLLSEGDLGDQLNKRSVEILKEWQVSKQERGLPRRGAVNRLEEEKSSICLLC